MKNVNKKILCVLFILLFFSKYISSQDITITGNITHPYLRNGIPTFIKITSFNGDVLFEGETDTILGSYSCSIPYQDSILFTMYIVCVPNKTICLKLDTLKNDRILNYSNNILESELIRRDLFFKDIYFGYNSDSLNEYSETYLSEIAYVIKKSKTIQIEIRGSSDNNETIYNISLQRANIVFNYLTNLGVSYNKMKVCSFGDSRPIAPKKERENRRVELKVIKWDYCIDEYYELTRHLSGNVSKDVQE